MTTENKEVKDTDIIFFCKDCQEVVETNRFGKKYVYMCKKCGTKNVAFGTRRSISLFFRLDDEKKIGLIKQGNGTGGEKRETP